ncbi:hypothetical protein E2P81_ATG02539 [Venturia nashicola]|uniref:Rab-GAP TBC domain-containing protein n=1 Tax=Venturia nashicola TaxID=86259 RepID=A0A4Z1PFZ4_9PEZI|nr:hypothetical protein E6O75_ATG02601 [Venturia nashicola]TLD36757.1 hypothetical protein E2P81_ATG02539 [Venturia nashicola]
MRALAAAEKYWARLSDYRDFPALKTAILDAHEEPQLLTGLRSVCWKIFLTFRNLDRASWPVSLTTSRSAYDSLRSHYLRAIDHPDEVSTDADPLSEHAESPWTALRKDEALRQEIFQDVERCMPENIYFRQPATQTMLLDILFVYCKLNPDIGYRQGMHELLAPILWTVERDSVETPGKAYEARTAVIQNTLDSRFIEHDTFTLFARIMQTAKGFYDPSVDRLVQSRPKGSKSNTAENESPILVRCRRIFSDLLPRVDPGISSHLEQLDITPQIFLLRWIRLLFGREFSFDDLLPVWDTLFAADADLELVDYICIAMVLRIRWQLAQADVNEALMLLMRYPSPPQPRTLVLDAIYLKSHCNEEGGSEIIVKYSNRAPPQFKRITPRPDTPDSNIGTPNSVRARSPFGSPAPRALDAFLGDTARGVLSRGEKWGFNMVRDAVGEVRKNVQTLQSGQPSPRLGPLHRATKSEVSNNIAANVLQKMTALEDRNRRLATMLETAVADLWKIEKQVAEKQETEGQSDALSVAVAKVQFVQVFLQDSTLPLPPDDPVPDVDIPKVEEPKAEKPAIIMPIDVTEPAPELLPEPEHAPEISVSPPRQPAVQMASSPPMSITVPPTNTPPASLPTTSLTAEHASGTPTSSSLTPKQSRPKIEQSSFSWMLGQAHEHRKSFIDPQPLSPAEKRFHAAHGGDDKGFLFGEENDVVGDPPKKLDKAKGKERRKNSGVTRAREDIGLGDMGPSV